MPAAKPSATSDEVLTELAAAWEERDVISAALAKDRDAAREARGLRELVCDLALSSAPDRELLTALHAFGHLLGERGATPSAVSLTMDNAHAVLPAPLRARLGPSARAAVAEGFAAALRDALLARSLAEWRPPTGIARLGPDTFAVAAYLPSREPDDIAAWSTRIARHLREQKARRVHVDGDPALLGELSDALHLAGLEVLPPSSGPGERGGDGGPPGGGERKRGLLSKLLG